MQLIKEGYGHEDGEGGSRTAYWLFKLSSTEKQVSQKVLSDFALELLGDQVEVISLSTMHDCSGRYFNYSPKVLISRSRLLVTQSWHQDI